MNQNSTLIIVAVSVIYGGVQLPVYYKANPDLVKSVTIITALREFSHGELVSSKATPVPAAADQVAVDIRMKGSVDSTAEGMLARKEIDYKVQLKTSSECLELEPGCLKIKEKNVLTKISTKTPI